MPTVWGHKSGPDTVRLYRKWGSALEKLHPNDRLRIKIDKDRNGKFNSLYHLMLDRLSKAINKGPANTDIDRLKRWVKIKTGRYDVVPLPAPTITGETSAIEYHSTSFAKMGEEEFHSFVSDTCELIRAELAPWVGESAEWQEVQEIIATIAPEPGQ